MGNGLAARIRFISIYLKSSASVFDLFVGDRNMSDTNKIASSVSSYFAICMTQKKRERIKQRG